MPQRAERAERRERDELEADFYVEGAWDEGLSAWSAAVPPPPLTSVLELLKVS